MHGSGGQNSDSVMFMLAQTFKKNHEPGSCFIFNRVCNSRIGRTLFQFCHAYVITKSQKMTESEFCPPEHRQHTFFD